MLGLGVLHPDHTQKATSTLIGNYSLQELSVQTKKGTFQQSGALRKNFATSPVWTSTPAPISSFTPRDLSPCLKGK